MEKGIEILEEPPAGAEPILSKESLGLVPQTHRRFEPTRQSLSKKPEFTEFLTLPAYPYLE